MNIGVYKSLLTGNKRDHKHPNIKHETIKLSGKKQKTGENL